ncbi:MAG: hypothetical protein ACLFWG_07820 [Longimicrobiales bacterium]
MTHHEKELKALEGRKIEQVVRIDGKLCGWYEPALALLLDDGTLLTPLRDPEGNGPGFLEVQAANATEEA